MFPPLPAALVAISFIIDAAEQVPKFDLRAVCGGENSGSCVTGETAARDQLAKQWAEFPAAERTRCVRLTTMSKMPSYVQVITCLEMTRDARRSPGAQEPTPSNSQSKNRPKRP
jgi:hypothetical protein